MEALSRVLIIDDNIDNLISLKNSLSKFDFDIFISMDFKELPSQISKDYFSLIILKHVNVCDLSFSKQNSKLNNTKILVLTDKDKLEKFEHNFGLEINYLCHPFDNDELINKVRILINKNNDAKLLKSYNEYLDNTKKQKNFDKHENNKQISVELGNAIKNNELEIYYQPKYNLYTKRITGMEALLRWNNKQFKNISPNEFIPIAEATGVIHEIGEWVISKVCEDFNSFTKKFGEKIPISINLSASQLNNKNFINKVKKIIQTTKADPEFFEFELTESEIMNCLNDNIEDMLIELTAIGFNLSIDRFGTGYPFLSKLKTLPISTVKVDRSFVNDMLKDENAELTTKTLVALSKGLGLNVVAQGIENFAQAHKLEAFLCQEGQGYFFSKPMPKKDIDLYFSKQALS